MDIGGNMEEITTKQMLEEVDKAIATVLVGGQSYKLGSRQLTRADLGMLRELKKDLIIQNQQEDGNLMNNTYVAEFGGR